MSGIEQKTLSIADMLAEGTPLSVIGAEYKKEDGERFLRIYIDKDGGVGLDDCENFSRRIEEVLDRESIIDEAYTLEVSSPGADRTLRSEREFLYYRGRRVSVKLYRAADGEKEFDGVLKDYDKTHVFIDRGGKIIEIKPSEAVYIKLYFEF